MERDEAIAVLKRQIEARGALPLADATAALIGLGICAEAEINEILSDGLGSEWAARRDSSGVVLTPLRSPRASGLPWETADDVSACWYCGNDAPTEGVKDGPPTCSICRAAFTMGSAQ